jgi:hypothetical protein
MPPRRGLRLSGPGNYKYAAPTELLSTVVRLSGFWISAFHFPLLESYVKDLSTRPLPTPVIAKQSHGQFSSRSEKS